MPLTIDCFGQTDIGARRDQNQDQFLVAELTKSLQVRQSSVGFEAPANLSGEGQATLLLVADGMGGHASGERASHLAVDNIATYLVSALGWMYCFGERPEREFTDILDRAMHKCQERIGQEAREHPQHAGMGTTLTLALIVEDRLFVAHVGDSRCYLLPAVGSEARQLTTDHTFAQRLIEDGVMGREEAERSRWNHTLWNVLGGDSDEVRPQLVQERLRGGDHLLLCTDGLTKHVNLDEVAQTVRQSDSVEETCHALIGQALQRGGSDNVTVILGRVKEDQEEAEPRGAETSTGHDTSLAHATGDTQPFLPKV